MNENNYLVEKISIELIYALSNNIGEENIIELLKLINADILIEKFSNDKTKILEYILEKRLSEKNINYILINFEIFPLKEEFIINLDNNYNLYELDNSLISYDLMIYILNLKKISIDIKVNLIITKIKNKSENSEIEKYIEIVPEISKLADVFKGNYPSKDISEYTEIISDALINYGYVKSRKDNKIMLKKNN